MHHDSDGSDEDYSDWCHQSVLRQCTRNLGYSTRWPFMLSVLVLGSILLMLRPSIPDIDPASLGPNFYAYESTDHNINPIIKQYAQSERPPYWVDPSTFEDVNTSSTSALAQNVFNPASFVAANNTVPSILHYIYLYADKTRTLPFVQFVGMHSGIEAIKPKQVMIWHLKGYPPRGYWFERLERTVDANQTEIRLMVGRNITEVHGNPVNSWHHKADVLRLEVLIKFGGIYLDMDNFLLRDFRPLMRYGCLMGQESNWNWTATAPGGLANGIIVTPPNSPFLTRWYNQYATFVDAAWNDHSVKLPWKLAKQYPSEITVLNGHAFYWPLWLESHVRAIHEKTWYDFSKSNQFVYQGWNAVASKYLNRMNADYVWSTESSFTHLMRRWVSKSMRDDWIRAGRPK